MTGEPHQSHGYRAVHLIVDPREKPIEIQIRTSLQHQWAELSEKMSDIVDPGIKYGSGNEGARSLLAKYSQLINALDGSVIPLSTLAAGYIQIGFVR